MSSKNDVALILSGTALAMVSLSNVAYMLADLSSNKDKQVVPSTLPQRPAPDTRVQEAYYQGFVAGRTAQLEALPMQK